MNTPRDDGLGAARGLMNGCCLMCPIYAFICLVVWALFLVLR